MKKLLILVFVILLSCSSSLDEIVNFTHNKTYIGKVVKVSFHKRDKCFGYFTKYTIIETDKGVDLIGEGKFNISKGDKCFIQTNKMGTELSVTWDGINKQYKIY